MNSHSRKRKERGKSFVHLMKEKQQSGLMQYFGRESVGEKEKMEGKKKEKEKEI